jgi:L-ribulose-5-phosphate 3-epimerase
MSLVTLHCARFYLNAYGVNSFSYMWTQSALDCVRRLARMGFDEFELMTMPGHLWPDELDEAQRRELLSQFDALGIRVRSLNHTSLDQNLCSALPEVRAYTIGLLHKFIRLARDLRAPNMIVVPGRLNPLLPAPGARHVDWLHASLAELVPFAQDNGVVLALENIPIGPIPKVEQVIDVVRRFDSPALKICYDVANGHYVGEDPARGLKAAAPWLEVIHFSDTTRKAWRHDVLGDGDIDFGPILDAVAGIGHARKPLIELTVMNPDEGLRSTLRTLSSTTRSARSPSP